MERLLTLRQLNSLNKLSLKKWTLILTGTTSWSCWTGARCMSSMGRPSSFWQAWLSDHPCKYNARIVKAVWLKGKKHCCTSTFPQEQSHPQHWPITKYLVHSPMRKGLARALCREKEGKTTLRTKCNFCHATTSMRTDFAASAGVCHYPFMCQLLHICNDLYWWLRGVKVIGWLHPLMLLFLKSPQDVKKASQSGWSVL